MSTGTSFSVSSIASTSGRMTPSLLAEDILLERVRADVQRSVGSDGSDGTIRRMKGLFVDGIPVMPLLAQRGRSPVDAQMMARGVARVNNAPVRHRGPLRAQRFTCDSDRRTDGTSTSNHACLELGGSGPLIHVGS